MSSRHRNYSQRMGMSPDDVLALLQTRAEGRAMTLGHYPSHWSEAKKRFGKNAKRAICMGCGKHVIVTPYGNPEGPKLARMTPCMLGDVVFEPCESPVLRHPDAFQGPSEHHPRHFD